jgi:phage tail tape-measure protein
MTDFRKAGAVACLHKQAVVTDVADVAASSGLLGKTVGKALPGIGIAIDAYDGYEEGGVSGAAGAAGGGLAGAAIGQALIPVPILGAAVGGMVGAWLGKKTGSTLGNIGKATKSTGSRTGTMQSVGGAGQQGPLASIQPGYGNIQGLSPQ